MSTRPLKKLLAGLAVLGACLPAIALADPTCVYAFGTVNGQTVTTPSVLVVVPDSSTATQPVQVYLDSTEQTILGYTLTVPGGSVGTSGSPIYLPGASQNVPSLTFSIPQLNISPSRCVDVSGASVPAVPVYVPGSTLTLPGAAATVGAIIVNVLGNGFTAPGEVITFNGQTIVIPNQSASTPTVPVGTPNQTITVDINGTVEQARYLIPNQ